MFAQQVISVLMEFADEGRATHLNSLEEALGSLQHASDPSASSSRRAAALRSYEQLRTLEEVWSDKDRKKAIQMIRTILRAPKSPGSKRVANALIDLFSGLQNQALWNFEQPKPISQRVMQRLCQLT
jgi:ABC-type hemin transport system substrate-binding protein